MGLVLKSPLGKSHTCPPELWPAKYQSCAKRRKRPSRSRSLLLATVRLTQDTCFHSDNHASGADTNVAETGRSEPRVIVAFEVNHRSFCAENALLEPKRVFCRDNDGQMANSVVRFPRTAPWGGNGSEDANSVSDARFSPQQLRCNLR